MDHVLLLQALSLAQKGVELLKREHDQARELKHGEDVALTEYKAGLTIYGRLIEAAEHATAQHENPPSLDP